MRICLEDFVLFIVVVLGSGTVPDILSMFYAPSVLTLDEKQTKHLVDRNLRDCVQSKKVTGKS